ncbi:uncharacterized protein LOC116848657 [Odontomachus brunneus]|uniref:uncharacterized protein LOC116848657 n=1 Tax=Odontomachus brunneus TaxID=486640 RepID=UPI0013F21571|nr:uncharacterized protein LOC116848657 [Odontomachus brunneus]XP_032680863.1 uncharacterized protein LOC116848657 [Odontomachus brunneus]XP_032680864.1 uncharacterized protein LOC116848657 [Odontomachus brunneus]XP_032680865.1 uncharacterized protein LOC116848657 [Odontomachus brunneus]
MAQNKKVDLSSMVNHKFTQEVLTDILCKVYDGKKVQLTDWKFGDGFTKGDNYLSTVYKGVLYGITDDKAKQEIQVNFVVKFIPQNVARKKTFRSSDFFSNEIIFYTQVVPKFEKFLKEKGQSKLLRIPHYLISYMDGENDFIVLEDLSPLGFGPASRQSCIDWAECLVILEALSKFHAISFAYKDQNKEEFTEMTKCLKETYFGKHNWNWYRRYHEKLLEISRHALTTEYPDSKAVKQFNSYKFGALYEKCSELVCERKHAPTSIICAGDCWAPNFLIRDIGQNRKEAVLLDFQLARTANPSTDLSFLIYSCTHKPFRDQYFDTILKTYHSLLSDAIKTLGSDPEKIYPWDLFMKEVKENFILGVVFAIEAIPFALLDPSELFDLDDLVKGDEAMDIADVWASLKIATSSGRRRLADMLIHAVEHGYL